MYGKARFDAPPDGEADPVKTTACATAGRTGRGPEESAAPRLLVVGGRPAATCRPTGQLEPRGYRVERLAGLPLPTPLPACDVVIFALPAAQAEAVGQACAQLRTLRGPLTLVLHPGDHPHDAA